MAKGPTLAIEKKYYLKFPNITVLMKKICWTIAICVFLSLFILPIGNIAFAKEKIKATLFYMPGCHACLSIKQDYIPTFNSLYQDKVEIKYCNIKQEDCLKLFLATEEFFKRKLKVPSILIGENLLVGSEAIRTRFEPIVKNYLSHPQSYHPLEIIGDKLSIRDIFSRFTVFTIIVAGLFDGINPCAFTVLIFFISFLTLMGYKRKDFVTIGLSFIGAVYLTYLLLGYGLLKGLYEMRVYSLVVKLVYLLIGGLCFYLAYLNLRDFIIYKKTSSTDQLKAKLPSVVRNRINALIGKFYRKDREGRSLAHSSLVFTALVVGFLVSLLEAVCTGQVYLPVIAILTTDSRLYPKAIFYLLLYNLMFITPLLLILLFACLGAGSKSMENFFRKRLGLVKIIMFVMFLGLGIIMLLGIRK